MFLEAHRSYREERDFNKAVSEPFPLGPNVQPVGLPPDGYEPPAGLPVTATGWGATEEEGHGACHGDSGSPLVHNGTQLGTVFWGQPTCFGPAAVYGNVASVGSWIRNTTEA
ncbi:chymotrypsin-1-like [Schistocerca serialis cubense]|uniref:chymotrypsin-1-like n=1 Tax=Schistocerca serialis cubense TaxID=2023355 RepID=UPI00214E48A2|nr:chymotrypsin-1-like [Schistocerca serialis cubense]